MFAFASEIAPLFHAVDLEKLPNQDAIREILATFATAHERTLFKDVQRLPPGSILMLRDGNLGVRRYWEPSTEKGRRKLDLAGHIEEFRHLFSEAVRAQTRSAYPIGCLLGGGLDAASVLCVAARLVPDRTRLSSYSMVFDRLPCDEREFIEPTVQQAGVESVFTIADAAPVEGWESLRVCHESLPGWPVQGLPIQSLWPLLDEARTRGVRVMLTGVGGDAVTQGSPYYLADLLTSGRWFTLAKELKRYRFSPHVLWFWVMEAMLPEWACKLGRLFKDRVRGPSDASFYFGSKEQVAWMEGQQLPRKGFPSASAWQEASVVVNPTISLAFEGGWEVLGQRGGLEFRHPFYDARLVEFLLSIPSEEKRRQGTTKYLLREAMKNVLPEALRLRKGKAEFSPMIASWLDSMAFDPGSLTLTRSGVIAASRVAKVTARRAAQPSPLSALVLWQLAVLETWYRLHFKPI
nr:asparagine synthetase B family protein [Methylococcus capsulatus]